MVRNLADYLRRSAARRPDGAALVVGATRVTWRELDAAVDALTVGFARQGLVRGDRVGLVLGNRPEFVTSYLATLRSGLVAVPLNPTHTAPEIGRLMAHAGARLVVCDRDTSDAVRDAQLAEAGLAVVGAARPGELRFDDLVAAGRGVDPVVDDDPGLALVMYTSGTTGDPRGAMLSHRALVASVEQVADLPVPVVVADDVVLGVLPLAHIYSLNGTLGAVLRVGATLVLVDHQDADTTLRSVRLYGVTNIPAAPPLFVAWAGRDDLAEALSGVRLLFSGAAGLAAGVQETLAAATGLPVYEGYGLTEAAPGVSSTLVGGVPKPGSVGRPFPGVDVRLVDEDGEDADEGDPGEIWVRGPNLFDGYWPDGSGGPDEDGWYATGDVAYLDADGDLHLVDRRKEVVIVSGFNVYPREVEDVLQQHPDVAEAAVVGVPHAQTGEAVKAYVVPVAGHTPSVAALETHCAARLARFKRPTVVVLVDSLPHSLTGKVAKRRLGEVSE